MSQKLRRYFVRVGVLHLSTESERKKTQSIRKFNAEILYFPRRSPFRKEDSVRSISRGERI